MLKAYRFMSDPARRAKVVMLSADTTPKLMQQTIDAGANAYLMKPIDREQLLRTLLGLLDPQGTRGAAPAAPTVEILDARLLGNLAELSPSGSFMRTLIDGFLADAQELMGRIDRAVAEQDFAAFAEQMHTLKGSAGNIGAMALYRACSQAREMPPEAFAEGGPGAAADLLECLEATRRALQDYLSERNFR